MFSLQKLLFLALIAAVIWIGTRRVSRPERSREQRPAPGAASRRDSAEDMVKCRSCGVYVSASGAGPCGRPDCPNR